MGTRKLCTALAVAALVFGVSACGGDDEGGGGGGGDTTAASSSAPKLNGKIAVLLPDSKSSDRWEKADRRFFEEGFKAAGLTSDDYTIKNAEGDPAAQRSQAEQAITEGANTILLVNLDPGSAAAIID